MKPLLDRYVAEVRSGPNGLFSRGDLERLELHAADGAAGAPILSGLGVASLVDIGSGGGVPGIPLAIEMPDAQVHLVESQQWKAEFLLTCARALDLESRVTVHGVRAEEAVAAIGRETLDAGVCRAVADPRITCEYLAPLVRVGGHLALWATREQAAEHVPLVPTELLGLAAEPELVPAPSELRSSGILIVWAKVAPCVEKVPRRPGVAQRKQLR
ncbi:MAG: rRNA methyltransferase [Thermoleophilia bacterium]|nr:rRNA methyltransferase [Thermoleophilia bacterium]MCZ4496210.1 rRNA methyltransferase [Thermoleophilia bacterium]